VRALRLHEFGGPLRVEEVPTPEPGPGQALVQVGACGVNHLDLWVRDRTLAVKPSLPHTLGSEAAGTVAALGPGAAGVKEGDRVAVHPYLHCGHCEFCLAGEETVCLRSDILGLMSDGGYAEYALVPAHSLVPLPEAVDAVQAAALALSALTAWHMLVTRARVQVGETVLVWGGSSGVGSAAVQIARRQGARVLATAGSAEKAARVQALGADAVVNYREQDVARAVRDLTGRRGVDVVVEHVGAATWPASVAALGRNGRLVSCGATTGGDVGFNLWPFFAKQVQFIGCYGGTRAELGHVLQLAAAGALQPVVDRTYALDAVPEALARLAASEHFGKLVITP
jgi:NADPH:quinone reductase-like Zn-dependent oxidoreductase